MAKTLFDKIWDKHIVTESCPMANTLIYIDRHLVARSDFAAGLRRTSIDWPKNSSSGTHVLDYGPQCGDYR